MTSDFKDYIEEGDRFRAVRVLKRIPQEYLEAQTRINQTRISQIDNGLVTPTNGEKKKLAKALGVPVSEIWPGDSKLKRRTLLTQEIGEGHGY